MLDLSTNHKGLGGDDTNHDGAQTQGETTFTADNRGSMFEGRKLTLPEALTGRGHADSHGSNPSYQAAIISRKPNPWVASVGRKMFMRQSVRYGSLPSKAAPSSVRRCGVERKVLERGISDQGALLT